LHWNFGSTLGKLSRMLSRIREIFIETLNKNFTELFDVRKYREIISTLLFTCQTIRQQ